MAIRRNLLDLLHGFALPFVAFALPWPMAFALYRGLARLPLYSARVAATVAGIGRTRNLDAPAIRTIERRHRLHLLLEAADAALVPTRGARWMRRHLRQTGEFPRHGNFIAIFFHFGTGFFGLKTMTAPGRRARLLLRPIDDVGLSRRPFMRRYAQWRVQVAERVSGGPIIFLGGARREIEAALAAGEVIVGSIDIPPTETHSLTQVQLLGHGTWLPHGLIALATEHDVPLVVYSVGLSADARERLLEVDAPIRPAGRPLQVVMQEVAAQLDRRLAQDPAGWHFWGWLDAFFPQGTFESAETRMSSTASAEVEDGAKDLPDRTSDLIV